MHEQRLTQRLHSYWNSLRKTEELPALRHFSSAAVEELWPLCMRVTLTNRDERVFKYDYMGTELIELYGSDLSGQSIKQNAPQFVGMTIHGKLTEVVQSRQPLINEGKFVTPQGRMMKYRSCFLPFGNKDGVTHIIIGLSFRFF